MTEESTGEMRMGWNYDELPWEDVDEFGPSRQVAEAYARGLVDAYYEIELDARLAHSPVRILSVGVSRGWKEGVFLDALDKRLSAKKDVHPLTVFWVDRSLKNRGTREARSHMHPQSRRTHIITKQVVADAAFLPFPPRTFDFIHESLASLWHAVKDDEGAHTPHINKKTKDQLAEFMKALTDEGVLIVDADFSVTRVKPTAEVLQEAGFDTEGLRTLLADLGWKVRVQYSSDRNFLLIKKERDMLAQ